MHDAQKLTSKCWNNTFARVFLKFVVDDKMDSTTTTRLSFGFTSKCLHIINTHQMTKYHTLYNAIIQCDSVGKKRTKIFCLRVKDTVRHTSCFCTIICFTGWLWCKLKPDTKLMWLRFRLSATLMYKAQFVRSHTCGFC